MKYITLIMMFLAAAAGAFAQTHPAQPIKDTSVVFTKPKMPIKPVFTIDPNKIYHVSYDLDANGVMELSRTLVGRVKGSHDLTGDQIEFIELEAKLWAKKLEEQVRAQQVADFKAWQDTVGKSKSLKRKIK